MRECPVEGPEVEKAAREIEHAAAHAEAKDREIERLRETLRRIRRTAELSAGIMRDPARTGDWEGAARVADQFDRIARATRGER